MDNAKSSSNSKQSKGSSCATNEEVHPDFKIVNKISKGASGTVYKAVDKESGAYYAVKKCKSQNIVQNEVEILKAINDNASDYFPRLHSYWLHGEDSYLSESLHGQSSECLKQIYGIDQNYNLILSMGQQMLTALEQLHGLGFVHCDIKPSNILLKETCRLKKDSMNWNSQEKFVLVDFSVSMGYVDSNGKHISKSKLNKFNFCSEFAAIEVLQSYRPTRKHDIISLFYTILSLLSTQSSLWIDEDEYDIEDFTKFMTIEQQIKYFIEKKKFISPQELCHFHSKYLVEFYQKASNMQYDERPDYQYLSELLEKCKYSEHEKLDFNQTAFQMYSSSLDFINKVEDLKKSNSSDDQIERSSTENSTDIMFDETCVEDSKETINTPYYIEPIKFRIF